MDKKQYETVERYMLSCMEDSAHDREHIYRVLHNALLIAEEETGVDTDVLICACLLHDIGRKEQFENPKLCHAEVGAEKAYRFLMESGFSKQFSLHVKDCIATHRFREKNQPASLEAKILFDADKLDAAGAMGIARTLLYQGYVGDPIYTYTEDNTISDGTGTKQPSFFREYKFKLEKMYDRFYTQKGKQMALDRKSAAVLFYEALLKETRGADIGGKTILNRILTEESR